MEASTLQRFMISDTNDTLPESDEFDIDLVGFLNAGLGLGESARSVHRALVLAGYKVRTIKRELDDRYKVGFSASLDERDFLSGYKPAPICICCLNGEHMQQLADRVGYDFLQNRKIIGIWFWETSELPENVRAGMQFLDEIWTCSEFTAAAIRNSITTIPVKMFPHAIDIDRLGTETNIPEHLRFGDRFVFSFSMDFASCVKRKNPRAVCEAFIRAFPQETENGPLCIIKSINGHLHALDYLELMGAYSGRGDILFMDQFLPIDERNALFQRIDCYVSLHRSEGLGLTLLEAMAAGKPCIATAYSGNLSFMSTENSFLVPYDEVLVGLDSLHYPADHSWAEPNIEAAAEAMWRSFSNGPGPEAVNAKAYVASNHSFEVVAKHISELVETAKATPLIIKKLPFLGKYKTFARERLDNLRDLEGRAMTNVDRWNLLSMGRAQSQLMNKVIFETRKGLEFTLKAARQENHVLKGKIDDLARDLKHLQRQVERFVLQAQQSSVTEPSIAQDEQSSDDS